MRPETLYEIEFKPRALSDLEDVPVRERERIITRLERLKKNLQGDVKRLTNFTPEYRLRVGNYRVLFETEETLVVIYRVLLRRDAY